MIEKFEKVANDCKMEMDYSLRKIFEWGRRGARESGRIGDGTGQREERGGLGVLKGREVRKIGRMKAVSKSFHSRNFPARLGVKNG